MFAEGGEYCSLRSQHHGTLRTAERVDKNTQEQSLVSAIVRSYNFLKLSATCTRHEVDGYQLSAISYQLSAISY